YSLLPLTAREPLRETCDCSSAPFCASNRHESCGLAQGSIKKRRLINGLHRHLAPSWLLVHAAGAQWSAPRPLLPGDTMRCCHADFALTEGSDRGFTLGMPTFTFGRGVLAEAGDQARELGLARVALFTDRTLAPGPLVAKVRESLTAAGVESIVFDEVEIEPTDESLQRAARFAAEARVDGYVSVGGGSVMDTCKAANLYASHPAPFMAYVNAPIGEGRRAPGPVKPHIACPTTAGTGSETTGIAIFTLRSMNAKTGIISRRLIPTIALVD